MAADPGWLDAVIRLRDGDVHQVATFNHFEAAIRHVRLVHCNEYRQMLDVLHMSVCCAIDVWRESSGAGKLIIDCGSWLVAENKTFAPPTVLELTLLFEKQHVFSG